MIKKKNIRNKKKSTKNSNTGLPDNLELTQEFLGVFNLAENTKKNVYVTGAAGTRKTTLLQYVIENTKKKVVVLAPTGVAALHIGGQTIHSFFGFPSTYIQKSDIRKLPLGKSQLVKKLDAIIIDEVSMVRADLMDAIDYALRLNLGKKHLPFGGIQFILVGDLCQLPPVVGKDLEEVMAREYKSPYFFDAHVFDEAEMHYVEMTEQYRQTDNKLNAVLNELRAGSLSNADLEILNQRVSDVEVDGNQTVLTMTNSDAKHINEDKLDELKSPQYTFEATVSGRFYGENSYPADKTLRLKKGASVMLLRNDPGRRWVNGTRAVIEELTEDSVKVLVGGNVYDVPIFEWEKIEYKFNKTEGVVEKEVSGVFKQYPLKLAWAVTVHKSQGQTFDAVVISTGKGAFVHGQIYVGLSRCRTFDGIFLLNPIEHRDIIFDPKVDGFKSKFKKICFFG